MKRAAYAVGAIVLAAVLAVVLLGPAYIDRPAVQAAIQQRLSRALQGQVAWEALEVALLPAPHGELRKLRIEVPGKLTASADDVNVYLRLWPLFRGRAEISSVILRKPTIRLAAGGERAGSESPFDAVAAYRAAMEPAARVLLEFAPDTAFKLEEAIVQIGPEFTLRDLRADARTDDKGVELQISTGASLWRRLSVEAHVDYSDLAARATVAVEALTLDKEIPPATLRAKLSTDGKSALDGDFDGSIGAVVPDAKGRLVAPAGRPPQLVAELTGVDLAQALAIARRKVGGLDAIESAQGRLSAKVDASLERAWRLQLDIVQSTAAVKLAQLPWEVSAQSAKVALTAERVNVTDLKGSLGNSTFSNAALQVELARPARLSAASARATLDLAQLFPWLQTKLPLQGVSSVSGSADATLNRLALRFDKPEAADFDAAVRPRNVRATLKALPGTINVASGAIQADSRRVRVTALNGSLGKSSFSDAALQVQLGKAPGISSGSARATLQLDEWFPWLKTKVPLEEVSSVAGRAEVNLNRLALRFANPAAADYDVAVTPRGVSAVLKALPAPVTADGGSVRAGPKQATLENVGVAMLDARTRVSGTIGIAKPAVELALADGVAGEKIVQWGLERGELPPRLEPRTPLRFAAKRVAWAPEGALEADARVDFDGGPQVAFALASKPKLVELPRIAIKDAASDAVIGLALAGGVVRASFSGTLQGRSIAAMLRRPGPETASGAAQGKIQLTLDRAQPRRTLADGRLRVDALDLSWLAGKRAIVERMDLAAEPTGARIVDARLDWDEQVVDLKGEVKRTEQGPVIDARLESPGVDLARLLPEPQPKEEKKEKSDIWPLPITGRIEMRSGFVQYKDYRVAPFEGRLSLERERARLEVQQARMCGVSFPMELEAVPEKVTAVAHISMRNEPFDRAIQCLTKDTVQITGNADLTAELRTEGRRPNLAQNLTGTVQAEMRKGSVKKFALIGNILSLRNIASVTKMQESGFPYRSMTAKGHFKDGHFLLEEGFFDSDAARLAANGTVGLQTPDSRLTVLVGLLTTVDRVTGAIPIVGYVFGGSLTALPVSVSGDIRNPLVVPLGPRAVTDSLLGIFERTLKLPGKLTVPASETKPPEK
jgi:uncharacterized protein involved in outer membrane biogenesis